MIPKRSLRTYGRTFVIIEYLRYYQTIEVPFFLMGIFLNSSATTPPKLINLKQMRWYRARLRRTQKTGNFLKTHQSLINPK